MRKKAFLIFIFLLGFLASQLRGSDSERKRLAYVSNLMSHSVSVIDLDSMKWLRDYSFGRYPIFSSLHPRDPAKMILALHNYERREEEDRPPKGRQGETQVKARLPGGVGRVDRSQLFTE